MFFPSDERGGSIRALGSSRLENGHGATAACGEGLHDKGQREGAMQLRDRVQGVEIVSEDAVIPAL